MPAGFGRRCGDEAPISLHACVAPRETWRRTDRAGAAADLVKIFVEAGATVEGLNGDGEPVRLAIEFGYAESAEALIKAGASIERLQKFRAGSQAAEEVKQRYMKK